ncbi:hypothetical protein EJB05_02867, partial [Eragrostis curvula]
MAAGCGRLGSAASRGSWRTQVALTRVLASPSAAAMVVRSHSRWAVITGPGPVVDGVRKPVSLHRRRNCPCPLVFLLSPVLPISPPNLSRAASNFLFSSSQLVAPPCRQSQRRHSRREPSPPPRIPSFAGLAWSVTESRLLSGVLLA